MEEQHLAEVLGFLSTNPDYIDLKTLPSLSIELKYATNDNFTGANAYGPFQEAFLHREAAGKLSRAIQALHRDHAGFTLRVFDALRPRSVQRVLFRFVEGTPQEIYVAHPDKGSMHNYGCAIDLTVVDANGNELDMGTSFDEFDPMSEPRREKEYLESGKLSQRAIKNRLILRYAMEEGGFIQLPHEWWHFNAFSESEVRQRFKIVE